MAVSGGHEGPSVATRIGVLALQGDVREHEALLRELGADVARVRRPQDLEGIDGLVMPGGESTTMSLLLQSGGLVEPLAKLIGDGLPVLGTCAGMILLAREIVDGRDDQVSFGAIDLAVRRNAFGRQLDSFETDLEVAGLSGGPVHAVFIRAPYVESVGVGVEVLASVEIGPNGEGSRRPVVCRQANVLVAAFHPELAGEGRLHEMFLGRVSEVVGD